ncbi:protein of unknown function [Paraburkholderia kururiensis]
MGHLGRAGRHAAACHGGSEAREPGVPRGSGRGGGAAQLTVGRGSPRRKRLRFVAPQLTVWKLRLPHGGFIVPARHDCRVKAS